MTPTPPPGIFRVSSKLKVAFGIKKKSYILRCSFKFPDNPQCKNIKTHLIWRTSFLSIRHFSSEPESNQILSPPTPSNVRSQRPPRRIPSSTWERKDGGKRLRLLCGTRYRIRNLLVRCSWLGGIDEIFAGEWLIFIYILIYLLKCTLIYRWELISISLAARFIHIHLIAALYWYI